MFECKVKFTVRLNINYIFSRHRISEVLVTCCNDVVGNLLSLGAVRAVNGQLVYHRLDLLPTESNCMHFRQLATYSTTTLH